MYLLYWIGQNWKWDKNEDEVYVGNGEWQVVDNLNELNDLIGSDIEVNDNDSDYEEEEEVRCVCDKCFGEGMCYVSKERARELERLELMESECPYGDKCEFEYDNLTLSDIETEEILFSARLGLD
tara:strand:- start:152 stop:526 length:375 start_codon:yes stop_codon:yes gene_type:complete